MPTGYTAIIEDDPNTTFRDYALRCARAFGALATLRDEGLDNKLPEAIEPSDYHVKELGKAKVALTAALKLTPEDAIELAERDYQKSHAEWVASGKREQVIASRYRAIRAEVEKWEPPTNDHAGVKKFMLEQIDLCLPKEPIERWWKEPKRQTVEEWRAARLKKLNDDIDYHTEHHAKEVARCAEATEWIRAYVASLPASGTEAGKDGDAGDAIQ